MKEKILTNTMILTFNQHHTPKEVKVGYCLERVEKFVQILLGCFKFQAFRHQEEASWGRLTSAKYVEKDPYHKEKDGLKEIRRMNCRQNHPAYSRSWDIYKKVKEIREEKHEEGVLSGSKEIVGSIKGEKSHAFVARKAVKIKKNPTIQLT